MRQIAPDPEPLIRLLDDFAYKPHWEFDLVDLDRGQGRRVLNPAVSP